MPEIVKRYRGMGGKDKLTAISMSGTKVGIHFLDPKVLKIFRKVLKFSGTHFPFFSKFCLCVEENDQIFVFMWTKLTQILS